MKTIFLILVTVILGGCIDADIGDTGKTPVPVQTTITPVAVVTQTTPIPTTVTTTIATPTVTTTATVTATPNTTTTTTVTAIPNTTATATANTTTTATVTTTPNTATTATVTATTTESGGRTPYLYGGNSVPVGELEAVGQLNGGSCTATLITYNQVLTAAHCTCPSETNANGCSQRASFTLNKVFPIDNPSTSIDESKTRTDITINGNVRVHPEYTMRGWLREDWAVVDLDQPANQVANVKPIDVEYPFKTPLEGDTLTLVGYGLTGQGCKDPATGKQKVDLPVKTSSWGGISFQNPDAYSCPGDSGGPVINGNLHVVGTASWTDFNGGSTYRPTSYAYNWIFNIPSPGWSSTSWIDIGAAGINSHQPVELCSSGSFVTALDLGGDRAYSDMDEPTIERARCSKLAGAENAGWSSNTWYKVEQQGINSHSAVPVWCPEGSYITGIDLDRGAEGISPYDSPVVGQVQCSKPTGFNHWGSSYWIEVGPEKSHQQQEWCLDGAFLTQFDLDAAGNYEAWDSPIIGRAKCSRPIS